MQQGLKHLTIVWVLAFAFALNISALGLDNKDAVPSTISVAVSIPGGKFTPLYGLPKGATELTVKPFRIDTTSVSNEHFYQFTKKFPQWSKSKVLGLLADRSYLSKWRMSSSNKEWKPEASENKHPVVYISWFAAHAYCESKGGRLPTVNEWEFVAAASKDKSNATRDPEFVEKLLAWYSVPSGKESFHNVDIGEANFWGLRNLHGLVWEWNEDFNSVLVTGDNREDSDDLKNFFCGGTAANAADKSDYAAFMRYALRNSLQARYALKNLGFRCAYDAN